MNDEPIAWIQKGSIEGLIKTKAEHFIYHCGVIQKKNQKYPIPLYTHPKEWRALTYHEINNFANMFDNEYRFVVIKLIENKLKEINNGSTN